jgi:hypothetical protein
VQLYACKAAQKWPFSRQPTAAGFNDLRGLPE